MKRTTAGIVFAVCVLLGACGSNQEGQQGMETSKDTATTTFAEAGQLIGKQDFVGAKALYARAADEAAGEGNASLEAEACAQVARMHSQLGDASGGAPWLARAEGLATPEMPVAWGRLLVVRGVYAREEGRGADATALFIECYDFSMANDLHGRAVDAAHHVAIAADQDTREEWALKGITAAEAAGEAGWLGPLWNNLGWDYIGQDRNAEALHALREAQKAHHAIGNPFSSLVADYSVGFALRKNGDLAEAREVQDAVHAEALRRLDAGEGNMLEWVAQSRRELGELDALQGNPAQGAEKIAEAIAELKQTDFMQWGADLMKKYEARLHELRAAQ